MSVALAWGVGACAHRRGPTDREAALRSAPACVVVQEAPLARRLGEGAAPGDATGPGRFVARGEAKTFYSAGGGRLWHYVNLYYWVPLGLDTTDLWLHAEIVETYAALRRWPDASPFDGPAPKRTSEVWQIGASGRSVRLDNHKDFHLLSESACEGRIETTITLTLGRARIAAPNGRFEKPRAAYVLVARDYGDERGVGKEALEFEPQASEPTTIWTYSIPWAVCPSKLTRGVWEDLKLPVLRWVGSHPGVVPPPRVPAPVLTTDR